MPEHIAPDSTAVRTALWRALHVELDAAPHVFEDVIGLALVGPEEDWRQRGDMNPLFTRAFRASMVARARFVEDLIADEAARGIAQVVLLGAGLDTFAQRRPELASKLTIFEVDRAGPQIWKRQRLIECGYGAPDFVKFVNVDFERGASWRDELAKAGFNASKPAIVASTGVSMYLTKETNAETLRQIASLAPGSSFAMTFIRPLEDAPEEERIGLERAVAGAAASGTPFVSFFKSAEILALAKEAGFPSVRHISGNDLAALYFAHRADGLRPAEGAEEILLARS